MILHGGKAEGERGGVNAARLRIGCELIEIRRDSEGVRADRANDGPS
jgi:hypothetical protein